MIELAAVGVAGGVIAGLLGVGGGVIFVPALVLFANAGQLEAEATSLIAIVPVAVVGAWRQHRYGNVDLRDGALVGLLGAAGAAGGVAIANAVPARALEVAFALLMLAIAAQLVRDTLRERR